MKIYHTSPVRIEKIESNNSERIFGEFLFFSGNIYAMTASEDYFVYSIEIDKDDMIDVSTFFYREDYEQLDEFVEKIQEMTDCSQDEAQEILSGEASIFDVVCSYKDYDDIDHEQLSADDWKVQKLMGEAAKKLGYRAAESKDEQGAVYIVAMHGKEHELQLIS